MIYFRVVTNLIEEGKFVTHSQVLEEMEMYKLLQRLGAKRQGVFLLQIKRLDQQETITYEHGLREVGILV